MQQISVAAFKRWLQAHQGRAIYLTEIIDNGKPYLHGNMGKRTIEKPCSYGAVMRKEDGRASDLRLEKGDTVFMSDTRLEIRNHPCSAEVVLVYDITEAVKSVAA
jgi:hypothetical protein